MTWLSPAHLDHWIQFENTDLFIWYYIVDFVIKCLNQASSLKVEKILLQWIKRGIEPKTVGKLSSFKHEAMLLAPKLFQLRFHVHSVNLWSLQLARHEWHGRLPGSNVGFWC
jgi:hypothetical protein